VELAVTGARVKPIAGGVHPVRYAGQAADHERVNVLSDGASLVLEKSGRKIAYSRLRVTDATGRELSARMVVGRAVPCAPGSALSDDDSETADGARGAARPTLVVLVDDAHAVYPIRIDPTFSDANWISMGGHSWRGRFGPRSGYG
jgi:hypothetical protein